MAGGRGLGAPPDVTCSMCGLEGTVKACPYCGKPFCRTHYESHVLWERKHEYMGHKGSTGTSWRLGEGPHDYASRPRPKRRVKLLQRSLEGEDEH